MPRKLVCYYYLTNFYTSNKTPTRSAITDGRFAAKTGFFGWNLATYALREQLNITAQQLDPIEDEFVHAKLEKEDAKNIPVPLVKDSPVRFECQFDRVIELPGNPPMGTVSIRTPFFLPPFSLSFSPTRSHPSSRFRGIC